MTGIDLFLLFTVTVAASHTTMPVETEALEQFESRFEFRGSLFYKDAYNSYMQHLPFMFDSCCTPAAFPI